MTADALMDKFMGQSTIEFARDLIRVGDLNGAKKFIESELARIENDSNATDVWHLRFIRARVLDAQGHTDEALGYLESLPAPAPSDIESMAALKLYRGDYSGFLGRYEISHRLFAEAETMARDAALFKLLGDIHLSQAFIFFRQKDYVSSDRLFRAALDLTEKVEGWYLRGHGLWGIGKI